MNIDLFVSELSRIYRAPSFRRFLMSATLIVIIALLLGLGVALVVQGLLIVCLHLSSYWTPARKVVRWLSRTGEDEDLFVSKLPLPKWRAGILVLRVAVWLGVSGFGLWLIWKMGLLGQNLIYMILTY